MPERESTRYRPTDDHSRDEIRSLPMVDLRRLLTRHSAHPEVVSLLIQSRVRGIAMAWVEPGGFLTSPGYSFAVAT